MCIRDRLCPLASVSIDHGTAIFRLPDGTGFEAVIEGVRPTGELLLRHDDGSLHGYLFREVEFVIKNRDKSLLLPK